MIDIEQADILEWSARYDGEPFHAAMMDAPYEEEFMGKGWDATGVAFNPTTWAAIAKHLHPGAFLFVFAGTLNDDLISVAMRHAGLRKYHRSGAWLYGSGFPKAAKLDTIIDRRAGVERTKVGTRKHQPKFDAAGHGYRQKDNGFNSKDRATFDVTKPATELAETWQGHRYGGQMLKPALESLLIFQKPVGGDMVTSITSTGAGALWIDGGRIDTGERWTRNNAPGQNGVFNASGGLVESAAGRWPANFSLSHHPDCNGSCVPSCPVRRLGEQSGESTASNQRGGGSGGIWSGESNVPVSPKEGDTGTAARFFHQADYIAERIEASDPVGYYAKASRSEREAGLDDMQARIMRELYGSDADETERADAESIGALRDGGRGGRIVYTQFAHDTINDGRETPIDNPYQRGKTQRKNIHPTIKPIALNRWIATLLLPPERYGPRRLLVPFAGAGSEMIGAMLAGWEHIQGIELEAPHVQIARARLAFWQQMKYKLMNPDTPVKVTSAPAAPEGQHTLW